MNKIMKSAIIFKQMFIAMAALTMVGCLSSCKDQDFDWDAAHANTAQAKFDDAFFKAFGKPAENHQWGFDFAWANDENQTRAGYFSNTLTIVKPDTDPNEIKVVNEWGTVPNISQREHIDVYKWFRTHQVTWENTVKSLGNYKTDQGKWVFQGTKADGKSVNVDTGKNEIPENGLQYTGNAYYYEPATSETPSKSYTNKNFYIGMNGEAQGEVVMQVYFDYTGDKKGTRDKGPLSATCIAELPTTSSDWPTKYSIPEIMGNNYNTLNTSISVGTQISFTHAWIQHVAREQKPSVQVDQKDEWNLYSPQADEYTIFNSNTATDYAGVGSLDWLRVFERNSTDGHTFDFNNAQGYGYGNQVLVYSKDATVASGGENIVCKYDMYRNGALCLGADLNNLAYHNSLDNRWHDKWIIVYLKGGYAKDPDFNGEDTRFEGWYLGFDFEACGTSDDKQFAANGRCNDWIFKLTALNPVDEWIPPFRVMCEDLGGLGNQVTIDQTVHVSDIDYNDIVLDITPDNGNGKVTLQLMAAGGTLPLTVWYDGTPLFETHEFLSSGGTNIPSSDKYQKLSESDYKIMYNTGESTKTVPQPTYELTLAASQKFDINKLMIRVWRHGVADYRSSATLSYSDADWLNISNYEGSAPLKICVKKEVKWLKERHSIEDGYPNFKDWVRNPGDEFWKSGKTIVQNHLYTGN